MSSKNGETYQPATLIAARPVGDATAKRMLKEARALTHPTPAGWCDPVSITLVLDLLLRLENDTTLRARHLTDLLTQEYPQVAWNPNTVGRILSELSEAAAVAGATTEPPIERNLTRGGNRFVVNVNTHNWNWLLGVRARMYDHALQQVRNERATGEFERRSSFPFDVAAGVRWGVAA